jgi:hypothetical protein
MSGPSPNHGTDIPAMPVRPSGARFGELASAVDVDIGAADRRQPTARGVMPTYRVTFSKTIFGVPFPIASVPVRHARSPERARRAAELRLMRRRHVEDWRLCADTLSVEPQAGASAWTKWLRR